MPLSLRETKGRKLKNANKDMCKINRLLMISIKAIIPADLIQPLGPGGGWRVAT
jgi:hypothetical protein